MKEILFEGRKIPVMYEPDVLVVGSGMTGICAAIAAAEEGKSVLLLEQSGKLGGNFTRSLIGSFNGYTTHDNGNYPMLIKGLGERILQRMTEANAIGESITLTKLQIIPYDEPMLEHVLDQLVTEAGVRVLFHQLACDVIVNNNKVDYVVAYGKSGFYGISAKMVVDASGDGDIAAKAGVPSLTDGNGIQFPSTSFYLGGVDMEKAAPLTKPQLGAYMRAAVERGEYDLPRVDGTLGILPNGLVRGNMGRLKLGDRAINPLNPDEVSWGEMEGRRQAFLYLDFLRKNVPGYENAFICNLPEHLGVRETRRLQGRYVMVEEDFQNCARFDDGVALSAHPVERHGAGATTDWIYLPDGEYVEIPLRCLMPEKLNNLFFGGRCVSAVANVQAAIRAGASCMSMGEAIGVAASMAIDNEMSTNNIDVSALRKRLVDRKCGLEAR